MRNYYENTVIPAIVLACLFCLGWWWMMGNPIMVTDIPKAFGLFIIPMSIVDFLKKPIVININDIT